MANHSHRSGKLKQTNKKNKRATSSKRSKNRLQGGKVQSLPSGGGRKGVKSNDTHGKAKFTRMNAAKQRRDIKRKECWNARRGIAAGGATSAGHLTTISRALSNAPPRIVGIISLSELEGPLEERVRMSLAGGADKVITSSASVTTSYSIHAKGGNPHVTMLTNTSSFRPQYSTKYGEEDASVQGALDLCRVCDLVLFLIDGSTVVVSCGASMSGGSSVGGGSVASHSIAATSVKTSNTTAHLDHLVSERGDRILTAIKAQGMPTPLTIIVHKESSHTDGDVPTAVGAGLNSTDNMDDDGMDEDEYEEPMDDGFNSLHGTLGTSRSMKSIRRSYMRRRSELKRYVGRLVNTEFGEGASKVVEIDIVNDTDGEETMDEESVAVSTATGTTITKSSSAQNSVSALIRMLCTMAASGPNWVTDAPRPYLVTDGSIAHAKSVQYDEATKELQLTGYVNGNSSWNCNQLVHVPHLGTFAVKHVKLAGVSTTGDEKQLFPPIVAAGRKVRRTKSEKNVDMEDAASKSGNVDKDGVLFAKPDPEERESLEMFASPDALEGEQNLIGFDDDNDHNIGDDDFGNDGQDDSQTKPDKFKAGTSRPAGWSDYQSAWLDALDPNEEGEDHGELAFALNKKSNNDADTVMDDEDDQVNAEEKRQLLAQRKKNAQSDLQFPDEADHEDEDNLRDRYARYRAIQSFRQSYWDPKENLPDSYGAVYHFASFKATQRDVLEDVKGLEDVVSRRGWGVGVGEGQKDDTMEELDSEDEEEEDMARACVPPGAYVTITLEGVPPSSYSNLSPHTLLSAVSLLPHENKVSVLHMGLTTQSSTKSEYDTEVPIKSKDVLTFRCGWRTWKSRPIFSQLNLNSDKHKFERFMPSGAGTFFAGSVFGPVTYAQCPVMMFREANDDSGSGGDVLIGEEKSGSGRREFLAHGSMIGADADRIVLKRIVLTGFPTRVHKRHATVKYMFYNPEDVKWFMPAGITTKHGLQGNIVQSVGDHGVMKCLFNAPIKQHDTVCLPLYKRVFPKFSPVEEDDDGVEEGGAGSMSKHFRVL